MLATHKLSEPETLAYHQRSTVRAGVFLRSMMATAIVSSLARCVTLAIASVLQLKGAVYATRDSQLLLTSEKEFSVNEKGLACYHAKPVKISESFRRP